jgi:hypothetical protein
MAGKSKPRFFQHSRMHGPFTFAPSGNRNSCTEAVCPAQPAMPVHRLGWDSLSGSTPPGNTFVEPAGRLPPPGIVVMGENGSKHREDIPGAPPYGTYKTPSFVTGFAILIKSSRSGTRSM